MFWPLLHGQGALNLGKIGGYIELGNLLCTSVNFTRHASCPKKGRIEACTIH